MNFNPLKTFKEVLNQTGEQMGVIYDDVTVGLAKTATEVAAVTEPNILPETKIFPKVAVNVEKENKFQRINDNLVENVQSKIPMLSNYKGCYSDSPDNPILPEYLGIVSNVAQCIKLGSEKKLNYVGIQQGDVCYGGNDIPTYILPESTNANCDISCSEAEIGTCGGYFYSQIYDTGIKPITNESTQNIETFNSSSNFKPLKPFVTFGWIVLILIILLITICYFKNVDI